MSIEERIPANPSLLRIRKLANQAFMPPEKLLLAWLLQAFYRIRSERLLLEQLHCNLLFRWFMGLSPDDLICHPTTFGLRPTASTAKTVSDSSMTTSSGASWRS